MNKKTLIGSVMVGLAGISFIIGIRIGEKRSEKRTKYAGVLNITSEESGSELYLSLDEHPKNLKGLSNVIFKVNKLA